MPDAPSQLRLRELFANLDELNAYVKRRPDFLRTLGSPDALTAWNRNPLVTLGESRGVFVRRQVDKLFESHGQEHTIQASIVSDPVLGDMDVELTYEGSRLGDEDRRNLGREADIEIVDVIDLATRQSVKEKLSAAAYEDLLEKATLDFGERRFDHLDRFADD